MPAGQLERNAAKMGDVLRLRGPPDCMSAETFKHNKSKILRLLRSRTDPPPRLMRAGEGDPERWNRNLVALLEDPQAVAVRGWPVSIASSPK